MTKAELVAEISAKTGQEEAVVLQSIEAMMKVIRESLVKGENVYLRGFGSFIIKKRARKVGRNITKNTFVIIPEHFIPAFKPVKTFVTKVKSIRGKVNEMPMNPSSSNGLTNTGLPSKSISASRRNPSEGKVVKISRTPLADRSWDDIRGIGPKTATN